MIMTKGFLKIILKVLYRAFGLFVLDFFLLNDCFLNLCIPGHRQDNLKL